MAANVSPIFLKKPRVASASTGLTANTALDGSGTLTTLFTADPDNGSKIEDVVLRHLGTNVATVVRFFIFDGTSNHLVHEETMAANTLSQVAASVENFWKANQVLPAGYALKMAIGTAIASGIKATASGGDY